MARGVARALGYQYVDTGAMYRAVALVAREHRIDWSDEARIAALASHLAFQFLWDGDVLRVRVEGRDITKEIRLDDVGRGGRRSRDRSGGRGGGGGSS